jgi:hypothetical protein
MKAAGIVSGPIFFGRLIKRSRLTLRSETWMRITWLRTSRTEQCRSGWSAAREIDAASMVMLVRWRQIVSGGQWRAMSHSVHGIFGILDNVDSVTYRIQKRRRKNESHSLRHKPIVVSVPQRSLHFVRDIGCVVCGLLRSRLPQQRRCSPQDWGLSVKVPRFPRPLQVVFLVVLL